MCYDLYSGKFVAPQPEYLSFPCTNKYTIITGFEIIYDDLHFTDLRLERPE